MIRPCFNKLSSAVRTAFDGIANPIPCEPPLREDNRHVDPNDLAAEINQRPAAVAGIDGRVGLQQFAESVSAVWRISN